MHKLAPNIQGLDGHSFAAYDDHGLQLRKITHVCDSSVYVLIYLLSPRHGA